MPAAPHSRFSRKLAVALVASIAAVPAMAPAPAWAQTQPPGGEAPQPGDHAPPLSARYRFEEKYVLTEDPARPEALSQYLVATRETTKITNEKPQGAPDVAQTVLQSIYTERVAKINNPKDGLVGEIVRRYDRVRLTSTVPFLSYKTPWLEGLTILYRLTNRMAPQVLSLSDRQLRQQEYEHITLQTFLPVLATVLPRRPARVGDRWPVSRPAVWALVGEMPADDGREVTAELREVRPDPGGKSWTAVIDLKGEFTIDHGPSAVNARLEFRFVPTEAQPPAAAGREAAPSEAAAARAPGGMYDAKGYISKVRMAQVITAAMPGSDARLKQTIDRSLVLERRTSAEGAGGGSNLPLTLPSPPPPPSIRNSWLLYDDPRERFHLLHPQEFQVVKTYPDGGIDLLDRRPDGQDVIQVNLVPRGEQAERDRLPADPLQEKRLLEEEWKKRGEKVLPGPSGWLPEADWAALKRRVYRIEAALVPDSADGQGPAPTSGRIYMDRYIVQFTSNQVLRVTAMTTRDPHVPFRDLAESLIKTFAFGPSEGVVRSAPGGASPAAGAAAR